MRRQRKPDEARTRSGSQELSNLAKLRGQRMAVLLALVEIVPQVLRKYQYTRKKSGNHVLSRHPRLFAAQITAELITW